MTILYPKVDTFPQVEVVKMLLRWPLILTYTQYATLSYLIHPHMCDPRGLYQSPNVT